MFQFSGFALPILCIQMGVTTKGSWVSPFGNPRVKACLLAHRGLSQVTTSFIASYCLGIHRIRLFTWSYNPKTSGIILSDLISEIRYHIFLYEITVTIEYTRLCFNSLIHKHFLNQYGNVLTHVQAMISHHKKLWFYCYWTRIWNSSNCAFNFFLIFKDHSNAMNDIESFMVTLR